MSRNKKPNKNKANKPNPIAVSRPNDPGPPGNTAPKTTTMPEQAPIARNAPATGYKAAMADGKIGRNEIQAHMDAKGIKGKQQGNAQMRIADRWLSKGGALGQGVLKDYMSNYESKNYYSAMGIKHGINPYGVFDADTKGKSKNDLYKAANSMFANKGYAKGDAFSRLKNGDLRALPPMPTGYVPPTADLGGGGTGDSGLGIGDGAGAGDTGIDDSITGETDPGFTIQGGGNSSVGANALGIRKKKSSWAESRRNAGGTGNLARSNFSMGINTGLK